MAAGLQAGTVLVFSIDTDNGVAESYGLVQSVTRNNTVQRAEGKGADGHVVSIQEFDDRVELSLNYLELGTPVGEPAIGSAFTYDGSTYYVSSASEGMTVDGFKTVDITATNYPHLA